MCRRASKTALVGAPVAFPSFFSALPYAIFKPYGGRASHFIGF
jgi:hypothetical protein